MDNKRLLVAAALSLAILFGWQMLFPPPEAAPRPATAAGAPATADGGTAPSSSAPQADGASSSGDGAPVGVASDATVAAAAAAVAPTPVEASAEETLRIENSRLTAELSNRGGVLTSLRVRVNGADGERLEMVTPRAKATRPFALFDGSGEPLALNEALFAAERSEGEDGISVTFRYSGAAGTAEKRFLFRPDGRVDFDVEVHGKETFDVRLGPGLRARSAEELASRFMKRRAVWSVGGKTETLDPNKARETLEIAASGLDWVGLEDTYFLTAFIPTEPLARARFRPVLLDSTDLAGAVDARPLPPPDAELSAEEKKLPRDLVLELEAQRGRVRATSYWGPKQVDRLASFPWGLDRTVELGMFGILARPMLKALQWIHDHWVANYGWAIVILTTALKLLLLPLSISAFKSMRKMQAVNPKIQAIRERWKGKLRGKDGRFNPDAQRQMNEEVMGLYRAEGVNPAGGCLPMLIQLPIFFAYYSLLSTAVELWRSPWIGWIHDLTAADPYYVLPIFMGVSQIVQQRMTPPPPDPVQKKLMQFLPFVFTIFSLGFPAGLVLYWITNNVLTIAQQRLYNSFKDHGQPVEVVAAPSGKKGRKAK